MNLGSWFVLAIVIALLLCAIKATFFKRKSAHGGCCDTGDVYDSSTLKTGLHELSKDEKMVFSQGSCCGGCSGCASCLECSAVNKNAVLPIVKTRA